MLKVTTTTLLLMGISTSLCVAQSSSANLEIKFEEPLWEWDGFGVNYVQTRHTRDYKVFPQDYGGFKYLSEEDRQTVMDMIFGEDGLRPGIIKVFADPFHEPVNDNDDPFSIDMDKFDHTTTTEWILYFCREAEKRVKVWDGELVYLACLYGPPSWMSKQKDFRGRDLDNTQKYELAEYLVSWAKYLRETEGLNVQYISPHNEGEDSRRWAEDGTDDTLFYKHDFNMLWPAHQTIDFLTYADEVLYHNGMLDVKLTNGEMTTWRRLHRWWYPTPMYAYNLAQEIKSNPEAMKNLGLITSHGFMQNYYNEGIAMLRDSNPGLHAWTTSYTWDPMNHEIVEDARNLIYNVQCNGLIPWAIVHNAYESDKLSPPMGFRQSGNADSPFLTDEGELTITKAYYYYKQICRAGQPHMNVVAVQTDHEQIQAMAFGHHITDNPDAFMILNKGEETVSVKLSITGSEYNQFEAFRTSDKEYEDENYKSLGKYTIDDNEIIYEAPPKSATTFYGIPAQ